MSRGAFLNAGVQHLVKLLALRLGDPRFMRSHLMTAWVSNERNVRFNLDA